MKLKICGDCEHAWQTTGDEPCPVCGSNHVVNVTAAMQGLVLCMVQDAAGSSFRSQEHEDGKAWVLRRAKIRVGLLVTILALTGCTPRRPPPPPEPRRPHHSEIPPEDRYLPAFYPPLDDQDFEAERGILVSRGWVG